LLCERAHQGNQDQGSFVLRIQIRLEQPAILPAMDNLSEGLRKAP
jgi:hypothetical protein